MYKIKQLTLKDDAIFKIFYDWKTEEKEEFLYTCRPVKERPSYSKYKENLKTIIKSGNFIYYLIDEDNHIYGKCSLFDINPRNKSGEFGYYFPEKYRGRGYGTLLIKLFIDQIFNRSDLNLNKLYATTASKNISSRRLLEKHNFTLDGIMRQHYWIGNERQDQICYSLLRKEWEDIKDNI